MNSANPWLKYIETQRQPPAPVETSPFGQQEAFEERAAMHNEPEEPDPVPAAPMPADPKGAARLLVRTQMEAAETIQRYLPEVIEPEGTVALTVELQRAIHKVNNGDLSDLEGTLVGQAQTLNQIFHTLSRQAWLETKMPFIEGFLKLALRAQSQCRVTIETLAAIKNPPNVAFVKQANVAQVQQVNNGQPAATPTAIDSTHQLEQLSGNYLDAGTTTAAGNADSAMATVGEIHRTEDRQG